MQHCLEKVFFATVQETIAAPVSPQLLALSNCRNIEIRPSANYNRGASWQTCTNYQLKFQTDGNLVLYSPTGKPIWATGTEGQGADRFAIQSDGNVVLYAGNKVLWASNTDGNSGIIFAIQTDGNIAVYNRTGQAIFASNTDGGKVSTRSAALEWRGAMMVRRAKVWVDKGIPYNQSAYYEGFRQDCSGFISMAWSLPVSAVTSTLPQYAKTLTSQNDLLPGDAINNRKIGNYGHVVLFVR